MAHYNIDHVTLQLAANEKFGKDTKVSHPYWVDEEVVRVQITFGSDPNTQQTFGANFWYKEGAFR